MPSTLKQSLNGQEYAHSEPGIAGGVGTTVNA